MREREECVDSPLLSRLREAARIILSEVDGGPQLDAGTLLVRLVHAARESETARRLWLIYAAVATVLPTEDDLREVMREVELRDDDAAALWLLKTCLHVAIAHDRAESSITVVSGSVVVDVDFSSRHEIHTGIQRVVRSTLPLWHAAHPIVLCAWTSKRGMQRTLADDEINRVLRWSQWRATHALPPDAAPSDGAGELLIPWRCVVVLPEVPDRTICDRISALAQYSGNRLVTIGYDCIPIASADLLPAQEPNRFTRYLTAVKHMRRVAGISASAAAEFQGFADMLATQGLEGPAVVECALPSAVPRAIPGPRSDAMPVVVCVGTFEPRKNQAGVLFAAEILWREGLRFSLDFIGGSFADRGFRHEVRRCVRDGRPVRIRTAVSEAELDSAYATARFTVFASLHEGYGLPIAESFSHGTPVITSDYGSMRDLAQGGGAVLIDPRDDQALVTAMRDLLRDDAHLTQLRDQITRRPSRSWPDYADDLWHVLVEPELSAVQ